MTDQIHGVEWGKPLDAFDRIAPRQSTVIRLLEQLGMKAFNEHGMPVIEVHNLEKEAELKALLQEFQADRAPIFTLEKVTSEGGKPILRLNNPLYVKMKGGEKLPSKAGEVESIDPDEVAVSDALQALAEFLQGKLGAVSDVVGGVQDEIGHLPN
jgi:hypothetical protein